MPDITFRGVYVSIPGPYGTQFFMWNRNSLSERSTCCQEENRRRDFQNFSVTDWGYILIRNDFSAQKGREDLSETHPLAGSKKIEEVIFRLFPSTIEEFYRHQTTFSLKTEEKSSQRPPCHHQDNRKRDFRTLSVTDCGSLSIPDDVSAQNGREILYRREGWSFGCTVAAPAPGQTLIAVICGQ